MSLTLALAMVVAIVDGDSIKVTDKQQNQYDVRLAYIDAPELSQPYGEMSKEILGSMITNERVTLRCPTQDASGEWVCIVWKEGYDTSRRMINKGGAWVDSTSDAGAAWYRDEQKARKAKKGLWSLPEEQRVLWSWKPTK
ncbi:thermonuclease family protein [Neptunomonas phycophila]|uniref:Thermonuclease family protein n=1 Tax=Neptunomonas phycophila TaxID=1572645 RepID=A0ABT9EPL9_9GAMM|nr:MULTISPECIES: thermonuclease family protein [Neptunomonas]MDN2659501.1 thermonuclease family protein [Neptunomonas sp. CHC150]MDO6466596.1 thermonuclease family protein [Neptunomonas phycophila]MDP2521013.1 thermonuclease family protein [Neptunomonas phycophila]